MDYGRHQRPFDSPGLGLRLLPFGIATAAGIAIPIWSPASSLNLHLVPLIAAVGIALASVVMAALSRAKRVPEWCDLLPVFGFIAILGIARTQTTGADLPYLPIRVLAIWWLALYYTRSQFMIGTTWVAVSSVAGLIVTNSGGWVWAFAAEAIGISTAVAIVVIQLITRLHEQHEELAYVSILDPATGAANMRSWERSMDEQMISARALGHPFSIGVIRLGDLKELNEQNGYEAGDSLLAASASAWIDELREHDTLFRLYGPMFVVLMPDTEADVAKVVLERIRKATPTVNCAIGGAAWNNDENLAKLIARAEAALEEGKLDQDNHVVVYSGNPWSKSTKRSDSTIGLA